MIKFKGNDIESAIFDMDGTMFDTERLRFKTLTQAAMEIHGQPFTDEVLVGSLGLSAKKAEELAKQHFGAGFPYASIRRRADELELEHVRTQGVPVKPGLLPVLERLRKSGLKMAVATSSRRAIAEEYLINANVLKYFDLLVCGDEVTQGKPHPEIFERAATALNSEPGKCLMLEDSENGLRAACDAGGLAVLIEDIKPPAPEVLARAWARYPHMRAFMFDLAACTSKLAMPRSIESFPQAVNQLKAGIHGFGAMGGGYLAQVFSHWDGYTRPCQIMASTGNALLREVVNTFGKYSVRYDKLAFDQAIQGMHMIDPCDESAMIGMYRDSEIVALCLPEQAIEPQAALVAKGLVERYRTRGQSLTVLVVLNKVEGARFVQTLVAQALSQLVTPRERRRILDLTEFTETVVTRVVSKVSEESVLQQLRIKHDQFTRNVAQAREVTLDLDALTSAISADQADVLTPMLNTLRDAAEPASAMAPLHLVLFNSEADMALYAQQGSELLEHLRQVDTVPDITEVQTLKNRLWNGPHAIIAWYGALLGHATVGHAMGDARVRALFEQLVDEELLPALMARYPAQKTRALELLKTFRLRCEQAFKDPCERVARDPLRKLQRDERVFASMRMVLELGRPAPALALGAALAVWYALRHPGAAGDSESAVIREIYAVRHSLCDVLTLQHVQLPYQGLDAHDDAELISAVQMHFDRLQADGLSCLNAAQGQ